MRTLSEIQADEARARADLARIVAEASDVHARAEGRDLTPGEQQRWDNLHRGVERAQERVDQLVAEQRNEIGRSLDSGGLTTESGDGAGPVSGPSYVRRIGSRWAEPRNWNDPDEVRGLVVDALAARGADDRTIARMERVAEVNGADARVLLAASAPAYERAFLKMLADPITGHNKMTGEERTALERTMSVATNAAGGFMVPTHLDPTIILTNAGSINAVRVLARKVTLTEGTTWHGVSSDGVTASFDPELTEVSDDSPTIASLSIPVHQAQAFVPYSMQAEDDIANLGQELSMMFADAKDRLEGTKFSIGTGTDEPTGVWTAIAAVTASRVTSTTAATIGVVDINAAYVAVPGRYRQNASWLANPVYTLAVRSLGTAVSASFSGDLRDPPAGRILGRPVYESDDAPSTQTTTALDPELLIGDFSQYVVVDRVGMKVELVPHLMGSNRRPIGARGLYARWRVGGAPTNVAAFRVLVDKTSA